MIIYAFESNSMNFHQIQGRGGWAIIYIPKADKQCNCSKKRRIKELPGTQNYPLRLSGAQIRMHTITKLSFTVQTLNPHLQQWKCSRWRFRMPYRILQRRKLENWVVEGTVLTNFIVCCRALRSDCETLQADFSTHAMNSDLNMDNEMNIFKKHNQR